MAVVFDGVLLLILNWRLTLLQLLPAAWIWAMTWNLKNHTLANPDITTGISILIAVGILLAAQVAYWCNATFAYTIAQGPTADFRAAFRDARPHWRFISGLALLTGGVQAAIWLLVPHVQPRALSVRAARDVPRTDLSLRRDPLLAARRAQDRDTARPDDPEPDHGRVERCRLGPGFHPEPGRAPVCWAPRSGSSGS